MPRPLRPVDDELVHHVINRGNNRAAVFHDDDDYAAFLNAISDLKPYRPFAFLGYRQGDRPAFGKLRPIGDGAN